MSTQTTIQRLEDIIIYQLGVDRDQVKPEADIYTDLGADSLDQIELVMAIEGEWQIGISDEDAEPLRTVGQFVDYIDKVTGR